MNGLGGDYLVKGAELCYGSVGKGWRKGGPDSSGNNS